MIERNGGNETIWRKRTSDSLDHSFEIKVIKFTLLRSGALWGLLPVAIDRRCNEEDHGNEDSRNDDVKRNLVFPLKAYRADFPLAFSEFDLKKTRNFERRVKLVRTTVIKTWGEQSLTSSSMASELVSLRWRLEVDLGRLEGATRNNLSSSRIVTTHCSSPTNAWASLAVMALEKPRPCNTEAMKQWFFRKHKSPVTETKPSYIIFTVK